MVDVQNLTVPKFLARPSNTGDGFWGMPHFLLNKHKQASL
jgi:hypothetical protein